jgi:peptidoglycan hydrolase-like protein with peptidoglycan-binding domain
LQASLQKLGFLPSDARIDGIYGPATRSAISTWQTARGRSITGFIGDDDARTLSAEISMPVASNVLPAVSALSAPPMPSIGGAPPSTLDNTDGVSLKEVGGVYRVPVRINDAITLTFTVDSGASDVQIPADVILTLMRAETLSSGDFLGERTYVLADGDPAPWNAPA